MNSLRKIGAVVCVVFAVLGVISLVLPLIDKMYQPLYGTDPDIIGYSPPSSHHILGTDFMGRDIFSQLCRGAFTAFMYGVLRSAAALPVLVLAAFILSRTRLETPQYEDTLLTRYIRFIGFPLSVVALLYFFVLLLLPLVARFLPAGMCVWALGFSCLGWLAVGRDIEREFRNRKIPFVLFLCFILLVTSYSALYDGILGFFGLSSPSFVTWGTMVQWCYTSGYALKAYHWLFPPLVCIYVFSRGMLALSYSIRRS